MTGFLATSAMSLGHILDATSMSRCAGVSDAIPLITGDARRIGPVGSSSPTRHHRRPGAITPPDFADHTAVRVGIPSATVTH